MLNYMLSVVSQFHHPHNISSVTQRFVPPYIHRPHLHANDYELWGLRSGTAEGCAEEVGHKDAGAGGSIG